MPPVHVSLGVPPKDGRSWRMVNYEPPDKMVKAALKELFRLAIADVVKSTWCKYFIGEPKEGQIFVSISHMIGKLSFDFWLSGEEKKGGKGARH